MYSFTETYMVAAPLTAVSIPDGAAARDLQVSCLQEEDLLSGIVWPKDPTSLASKVHAYDSTPDVQPGVSVLTARHASAFHVQLQVLPWEIACRRPSPVWTTTCSPWNYHAESKTMQLWDVGTMRFSMLGGNHGLEDSRDFPWRAPTMIAHELP